MAKRRRSDDGGQPHRRTEKRRRLHVLTHDWDGAFSIFVSVGTKIFNFYLSNGRGEANIVFDTKTLGVTAAPPFRSHKRCSEFWSVGHTVYTLDCYKDPGNPDGRFEKLHGREPRLGHGAWQWEAPLPSPLFNLAHIESHAVHPDGNTVFMSIYRDGTFSFDGERRKWARHGSWHLPFLKKAYFVAELDGWIGLSSHQMGRWSHAGTTPGCAEPACMDGRDMLYRRDGKRHLDSNLTYMGNGEFCIQETLTREGDDFASTFSQMMLMLLRLVTFRVEYSADGELCTVKRREKIFKLTRKTAIHAPSAFWI
uniref:DUF295 domain-containing protein n=1 Tax=Oryza punctata TaxID=4537 RepID=A0A0E0K939_ORYPU